MKLGFKKAIAAVLMLVMLISMTSCATVGVSGFLGSLSASGTQYLTRDEVAAMIDGLENNVSVDGINEYNININSTDNRNLLAASKALLSAVSISCTFRVTYTTTWPTYGTYTSEVSSAGAGVIYQLDKEKGNAYIITNYHVVYNVDADTAATDGISTDIKLYLYGQEYADYAINAEYVGGSMNYDIAVLRVTGSEILMQSNAMAARQKAMLPRNSTPSRNRSSAICRRPQDWSLPLNRIPF